MSIPLPIIPQCFRTALKWRDSGTGQTAVNVMHFLTSSTTATASDVFTAVDGHVTANMWASVVSTAAVEEVEITPLDGTSATQTFSTGIPTKWTGEEGGQFIPQVAEIIKFTTIHRGRDNRGRIFLPFTGESFVTNGFGNSATIAAMNTAWENFRLALLGLTPVWELAVAAYDRKHAGTGAHATAVLAAVAESAAGTQRRRQTRLR